MRDNQVKLGLKTVKVERFIAEIKDWLKMRLIPINLLQEHYYKQITLIMLLKLIKRLMKMRNKICKNLIVEICY